MGQFLDKPMTEKSSESGQGNDVRYGVSSMQGWRIDMEDSHSALVSIDHSDYPLLKQWSYFGVFDGHAGTGVSKLCSEMLLDSIIGTDGFVKGLHFINSSINFKTDSETVLSESERPNSTETQSKSIGSSKQTLSTGKSTSTYESIDFNEASLKESIVNGFLKLDEKLEHEHIGRSGSTAVTCLLSPKSLIFANCGDSRAVLSQDGKCVFSTIDHKPVNAEEKARIEKAGGLVMINRVNGLLAVSRAFGDFEYKENRNKSQCEQMVSPEPEVFIRNRTADDQFIVIACDGIWDVMSNDDVCSFVAQKMKITNNLEDICCSLIDTCLYKGSKDNMTAIIITLDDAPCLDEEMIQQEKELDLEIKSKVREFLDNPKTTHDFEHVYCFIEEQLDSKFPPGGIESKRVFIESLFEQLKADGAQGSG